MNCRRPISASDSWRVSRSFSSCDSSVTRQNNIIPTQANSTATPWISDHSHGLACPDGVVEDQVTLPRRPDAVADHREHDVQQERRPVLVERDEPDDDEEVEVRLDAAVGEGDQRGGAVHEAERHDDRRRAAVCASAAAQPDGDRRHAQHRRDGQRRPAEQQAEDGEAGHVQCRAPRAAVDAAAATRAHRGCSREGARRAAFSTSVEHQSAARGGQGSGGRADRRPAPTIAHVVGRFPPVGPSSSGVSIQRVTMMSVIGPIGGQMIRAALRFVTARHRRR